jgi:hypothetical protein
MSSRTPQSAGPRLDWAARKLAGNALTAGDELLDFEQGHLRRFADDGAEKPVVTQSRWLRAVPFARGLAMVTYTRNQLLFLADGFGVNCSLVGVHRAELGAGNRQTFAFRRPECPLAMLELEPVVGERSRRFLDGFVVGSVCAVAVRKLFPAGPDIREVTAFVTDLRSRIHSTTPPGQHVCEAIIRDALRDKNVDFTNVSPGEMMHAQVAIAGMAVLNLGLGEAAIDEIVVEGERLAFDDGRHPPLAPAGT